MAQSLETYVAQATQAYQPAYNAIQTQLDSLSGNLATAENKINKNYAQQQAGLNRARNAAAETASMQAAGSGGSFGGAANIANRKYYEQSFVPAQTQMNTNKANELEQARQDSENQRASLNSQRANLEAQAQQAALQQYWAEQEAERNRAAQVAAAKASNPYMYLDDGYINANKGVNKQNVSFTKWIEDYSGWDDATKNYWIKNINNVYNMRSNAASSAIQNAIANRLQNTAQYKQYLNWRNS